MTDANGIQDKFVNGVQKAWDFFRKRHLQLPKGHKIQTFQQFRRLKNGFNRIILLSLINFCHKRPVPVLYCTSRVSSETKY